MSTCNRYSPEMGMLGSFGENERRREEAEDSGNVLNVNAPLDFHMSM